MALSDIKGLSHTWNGPRLKLSLPDTAWPLLFKAPLRPEMSLSLKHQTGPLKAKKEPLRLRLLLTFPGLKWILNARVDYVKHHEPVRTCSNAAATNFS